MKNKELEFELQGKILTVADMDWHIDGINSIYISSSYSYQQGKYFSIVDTNMNSIKNYCICIDSGFDIVELYYKSENWNNVYNQLEKLCNAIKEVNPSFKELPDEARFINFNKVEDIRFSRLSKRNLVIKFKNEKELVLPVLSDYYKNHHKEIEALKKQDIEVEQ